MHDDPELQTIDAIYDALERGDAPAALELAHEALGRDAGDDPVLRYLAGRALLELDQPREAALELGRAMDLDPDDLEFRTYRAWALLRCCRFDEAGTQIGPALAADPPLAEAHHVQGLLHERRGESKEAVRQFRRAAELAPEWFPAPDRFTRSEFDDALEQARDALSEDFRRHLDTIAILIEDFPPDDLLLDDEPPLDPEQLLGLFTGPTLDQRGAASSGGELPARIYLFRGNLERYAEDGTDLAEQIRVTLYHELGHYLGMEEDDLEGSGYG